MTDHVLHLIHRAGQIADETFGAKIGDAKITARQATVLISISEMETPSQTDLVDKTGIDRSTMADIVRRLVAGGLIARKRSKRDARRYVLSLTKRGAFLAAAAAVAIKEAENTLLKRLSSSAQREDLITALSSLVGSETLQPLIAAE